jgi:subtilisin family serine protease
MKTLKQIVFSIWVVCTVLFSTAAGYAQEGGGEGTTIFLPLVTNTEAITHQAGELIPDQYIVVFNEELVASASVSALAAELAGQYGGALLQTYDVALNGFAVNFPAGNSAEAVNGLRQDVRIAEVEQDSYVVITEEDALNVVQSNAPWGLDRINQRALPLNAQFSYNRTGAGVRVYIIDTGIRIAHAQFQGRASNGYDAVDGQLPAADCNGHGTHVAGTVGGQTYGVAKGVRLFAVRVLNCNGSGSTSGVMAGINWVTGQRRNNPTIPAVANMSLGGGASSALDTAVRNSINAGVVYAVAAGNANANACNASPARVATALTVGATASSDARASFSNHGSCLDLFAPGVSIISTWHTSNTATRTLSGTSMATPHVAGVAALYLQGNPNASPAAVATALINLSTKNVVSSPGSNSPNRLLYTNY